MTTHPVEPLLRQLEECRADLLRQVQQCVPDPALQTLQPDALHITPCAQQGMSKSTFMLQAGDHHFVLSLLRKDTAKGWATDAQRQAFKTHLRDQGVPVPRVLGAEFTLPGIALRCQLTEFCHGYQHSSYRNLNPQELKNLAHTFAQMHHASSSYDANGLRQRDRWTKHLLPRGVIHNDLHSGNVIFRDDAVAGVIDFECIAERAIVNDFFRLARDFVEVRYEAGCFHLTINDKLQQFLDAYMDERPLSAQESVALQVGMQGVLYEACRACNRDNGKPLDRSQLRREALRAVAALHFGTHTPVPPQLAPEPTPDMQALVR